MRGLSRRHAIGRRPSTLRMHTRTGLPCGHIVVPVTRAGSAVKPAKNPDDGPGAGPRVPCFNSAMKAQNQAIALALTGASGMQYGLRLLQCLVDAGRPVYLMASQAAQVVANMELDLGMPGRPEAMEAFFTARCGAAPGQITVFVRQQWSAPVASGSNAPEAMVICPCTTGTLASVAGGICDDLIDRAADVALKEGRKLVLVVRETPFSAIHLENMLRLARAGAVIMPANPGFYFRPNSVDDLVDFMVARILDHLGIEHMVGQRWGDGADG
jgi:flavin prenyltransferase